MKENKENKKIELTKDELNKVAGGYTKKEKMEYDTVKCPHCGAKNEVPMKDGLTVTCSSCGKQFQI